MRPRRNDKRVIQVAADAAGLPPARFFVEVEHDHVLVNHPESMKWPAETRAAIKAAVERFTGMRAAVT